MGEITMPEMPASFAAQWESAAEEDAQSGLVPSLVDEAIGDVLDAAGVTASDVPTPDQAPGGDEPVGEPSTTPQEPATPEPEPSEPAGGEEPPVPPGGPIFSEPDQGEPGTEPPAAGPQPVTLPDGRVLTPEQLAAYAELDRRITTDPNFRQGISKLLNPDTTGAGTGTASATPELPPFPQLSQEDLDNPAIQALIIVAERQRQETARLAEEIHQTRAGLTQREQRDHAEIVNGAVTSFQRAHNLPDDLMGEIRSHASRSNAMQLYLSGTDPRTGQAVTPDPYRAVEAALELGYWATPSARRFEFDRQAANRSAAQTRKQKLAGIGGTSGSGPRTPTQPDLSTEQGREQAAIAMLSAAFNGGEDEGA